MQIEHVGDAPRGETTDAWSLLWEISEKVFWLTAGVIVILGIFGCSSAPKSVSQPTQNVAGPRVALNPSLTRRPESYRRGAINYSAPSRTGTRPSPRLIGFGRPVAKGGGVAKLGKPYRIAGRLYVPRREPNYNKTGKASWYGKDFHGRKTANGEVYDMNALTAAHPTLPLPSYAYVTNQKNGRTVLVRINDRGPYAHNRIIDMSRASARILGFENQGVTNVRVRYAGPAPLNGSDWRELQYLAQQPWSRKYVSRPTPYGYSGLGGRF